MTAVDLCPTLAWRSLKEIVAHYMEDSIDSDGRSGAEVIRLCFREKERWTELFATRGSNANDRLLYKKDIRELDDMIERTRSRILRFVSEQAADGKWICLGRRNANAQHEVIPPRYWPFLSLDVDGNAVTGDGLSFRDLRCVLIKDVPDGDPIREALRAERRSTPEICQDDESKAVQQSARAQSTASGQAYEIGRTGAPGRPSSMYLIVPEFARRLQDGTAILTSVKAEAEALRAWFVATHPTLPAPSSGTIENKIREAHLKAKGTAAKPMK